jgi:hypothetical protein
MQKNENAIDYNNVYQHNKFLTEKKVDLRKPLKEMSLSSS